MFALMHRLLSQTARRATRVLLVVASSTLIGIAPSAASSSSTSTLRCGADALSVIWRGTTGGLAGTYGDLFWIRNQGSFACVVSGYPTIALYKNGARLVVRDVHVLGHEGNDEMGVMKPRRPPTVRLAAGATASFWLFGNDVMSTCANASDVVVSLRSLTGWASVSVPNGFSSWPFCGDVVTVNPIVPGVSGSDPARALRTEIQH
jgi:hypothetical protein